MGLVHAIVHPHHVPHLQICSTSLVLIEVVLQIAMNWIRSYIMWHGACAFMRYELRERGAVENIIENEELREHEERRDIYWEKNIDIEHYASRKHFSWELLDLLCVCCCCNLIFLIDKNTSKLQRAELFSEFSIPQDTQIKSIILETYEQCYPNTERAWEKSSLSANLVRGKSFLLSANWGCHRPSYTPGLTSQTSIQDARIPISAHKFRGTCANLQPVIAPGEGLGAIASHRNILAPVGRAKTYALRKYFLSQLSTTSENAPLQWRRDGIDKNLKRKSSVWRGTSCPLPPWRKARDSCPSCLGALGAIL